MKWALIGAGVALAGIGIVVGLLFACAWAFGQFGPAAAMIAAVAVVGGILGYNYGRFCEKRGWKP